MQNKKYLKSFFKIRLIFNMHDKKIHYIPKKEKLVEINYL
jgi:hypothetical protein